MELIDYFRILKALIILFLLYICVNYVPNQNGKVQEATLADEHVKKKFPFWQKRDIGVFTYIWTAQSLT